MLALDAVDGDLYCQGINVRVTDKASLAQAIALVLVQEYSLARALANGTAVQLSDLQLERSEVDDIVRRRLRPAVDSHRDGFLFQLMMWLAAGLDLSPNDLLSIPHSQASAKGQDSLVVHRQADAVVAITICEDKATENPRDTVRDEVWPEIEAYEAGGRRDELRSNVIATLGTGGVPMTEAEDLIRGISWHGRRRYRVRVTIEGQRPAKLFDGFERVVTGEKEKRRGEAVLLPSMRNWMKALSNQVEAALRTITLKK